MNDTPRRSGTQVLQEMRGGALAQELTDAIAGITDAVLEHQKVGKLVLTLTFRPNAVKDSDHALAITDALNIKMPRAAEKPTVFFADEKNNLYRNDPFQAQAMGVEINRTEA